MATLSQELVISKVLQDRSMGIITLNNFNESYFDDCVAEYRFIKNHVDLYGNVPDIAVFSDKFPEFEVHEVHESDLYLANELISDYTLNYLATSFNKMKPLLEGGKTDEAKQLAAEITAGLRVGKAIAPTDITKDFSRFDRFLEKCSNNHGYFISTGFEQLDAILGGGLDKENELFVIMARTGFGKSWMLDVMLAAASRQGLRVGLYSGEMSIDKVAYRIDTINGHMNNRAISRGNAHYAETYRRYIESYKKANVGPIFIITPNDIAGEPTVSAMEAFATQEKLDVLFIDQYSLMEDETKYGKENEKIANISKAFKKLQVKLHIPIVAVTQQNRTKNDEKKDKSMQLDSTQVYGSDRIGQDCTTLIGIERAEANGSKQYILNVVKARDGGEGSKLTYKIDLNVGDFIYVPCEHDGYATPEMLAAQQNEFEITDDDISEID